MCVVEGLNVYVVEEVNVCVEGVNCCVERVNMCSGCEYALKAYFLQKKSNTDQQQRPRTSTDSTPFNTGRFFLFSKSLLNVFPFTT